jgi:hypothetical protein
MDGCLIKYYKGAEDCLDALDLEKMVLIMADVVDELRTFRLLSFRQQWIPKRR